MLRRAIDPPQARSSSDDVAPEVGQHGEEGPGVQRHVEGLVEVRVVQQVVPVEEPRDDDQMGRAGDRQELGQSLREAENEGLEDAHGRNPIRRVYASATG